MRSLLFLILILASSFWCYENYGQNLPVHTTLSHTNGRSMEVVVLSREQTQVTFKRQSDGRRSTCEIGDLSLLSKCKVYWYFKVSEVSEVPVKDLHTSGMHKALVDLREELRLLKYYHLPAAQTKSEKNTLNKDIEALHLKINKTELKLAEHQSFLER